MALKQPPNNAEYYTALVGYPQRILDLQTPWKLYTVLGFDPKERSKVYGSLAKDQFQKFAEKFRAETSKNWPDFFLANLSFFVMTFNETKKMRDTYNTLGGMWKDTSNPFEDLSFIAGLGGLDLLMNRFGMDNKLKCWKTIDFCNDRGQTPLYTAARAGFINIVEWLVQNGANPDFQNTDNKSTPMHVSGYYGNATVFEYLSLVGARTNLPNKWGNTAEEEASKTNSEIVKLKNSFNNNALLQAANGNLTFFQERIDNNTMSTLIKNPPKNPMNNTILHVAAKNGHLQLVKLLLANGAKSIINNINLNKCTALHFACSNGHTDIVRLLLDNSADIFVLNQWGFTCFQEADSFGRESTLKFVDTLYQVDDEHKAAEEGNLTYFKFRWFYQFRRPFQVDTPDKDGKTFLYRAAKGGHLELFLFLLDFCNASREKLEQTKSTPLHAAAYYGHIPIVKVLLERGLDIYAHNHFGETPEKAAIGSPLLSASVKTKLQDLFLTYQSKFPSSESILSITIMEIDETDFHIIKQKKFNIAPEIIMKDFITLITKDNWEKWPFTLAICGREFLGPKTTLDIRFLDILKLAFPNANTFQEASIVLQLTRKTVATIEQNPWKDLISHKDNRLFRMTPQLDGITLVVDKNKEKIVVPVFDDVSVCVSFANLKKKVEGKDILLEVTKYNSSSLKTLYPKTDFIHIFRVELDNCDSQFKKLTLSHACANGKIFIRNPALDIWIALPGQPENGGKVENIPVSNGVFCVVKMRHIVPNTLAITQERIVKEIEGPNLPKGTKSFYFQVPEECEKWEVGWHGTRIENIQSILRSGLIAPAMVTNSGFIVKIPLGHIPKGSTYDGISDFPNAVFLSPFLSYSSSPVYSTKFSTDFGSGARNYISILECRVAPKHFTYHGSTTDGFVITTEDPSKMEIRVPNPVHVVIYALHFIPK